MKASAPEKITRRVAVILEPGGSSGSLLDVVLPLLGREKAIEMQGVFLEEAELRHAADLPFVKELCRVTFSVREFNSDQFERTLALRMRTAERALALLARRAGVAHTFRNVRGSAVSLLAETASQSDITIFEPARLFMAAMTPGRQREVSRHRVVVVVDDLQTGGQALLAASHLVSGEMQRVSVFLSPAIAGDPAAVERLVEVWAPARPGRVRTLPDTGLGTLIDCARSEGAAMLVVSASEEFTTRETLQLLRQRLRCPVCLVRYWGENGEPSSPR